MKRMNLFLVACPRAGSTQLARWLGSHPMIGLSPIKEPNFFAAHEFPPEFVAAAHLDDVSPERYLRPGRRRHRPVQFAVLRERCHYDRLAGLLAGPWRMEASTSYLACPEAPMMIHAYNPRARVILLTREPVSRALSHYRLAVRSGRTRAPLGEEIEAEQRGALPPGGRYLLRPGRWRAGISRFRSTFAPEQLLRLRFEDMIRDPAETLARICRFLGVAPDRIDLTLTARNRGIAPRFPALNARLQESGLKTRLRRHLPRPVKAAIGRVWFDPGREIPVSEDEVARLTHALRAAP